MNKGKKKDTNVDIVLDGLDETDIGSILRIYNDVNYVKKAIEEKIDMLQDKLKIALKEKKWTTYKDNVSGVSVSLSTEQRESVNKKILKILLNDEQYNQVITKTSFEKVMIINKEDRERLKKYGTK